MWKILLKLDKKEKKWNHGKEKYKIKKRSMLSRKIRKIKQ